MTRTAREAALEYAACLRDGDFERLLTLHHEDLVCSLLGTTRVSGRYRGRDPFYGHTFKHVLGVIAETDETYLKSCRIACADERYAVLLLHGGLPTKVGGRYEQNYLQIYRVRDGLVVELHELLDTVMLESQIFSKVLATPRAAPTDPLRPASKFGDGSALRPASDAVRIEQAFGSALEAADRRAIAALLHPEAVLQIAGTTPVSGTIRGREAIAAHLGAYVAQHFKPGTLRIDRPTRFVCCDEGGFCRLANASGQLRNGTAYRQTLGIVGNYCGETIAELYLYFDTALEERLVFDNPLTGGTDETSDEPFDIESALEDA